jgi:S1-C subfamily serine protease
MASFASKFKFEEFVRVTLGATFLVIGSRFLFSYTNFGDWVQETWAQGQERIALLRKVAPSTLRSTPVAITNANQSVVMLSGNQSIGSGVILTSDGLVLTNSHVIRNGGERWTVRLANEQEIPAHVVAVGNRDSGIFYDLALVQMEGASNLPIARFSEDKPQPGESVWAIGAPYGKPEVVTHGEVKQVTRDGVLLSTTEVHPGNSGGPLLNQNGEVIGINTEINPRYDGSTASISVPTLEEYLPKIMNSAQ